jgi:hypothetical protein
MYSILSDSDRGSEQLDNGRSPQGGNHFPTPPPPFCSLLEKRIRCYCGRFAEKTYMLNPLPPPFTPSPTPLPQVAWLI